jgi:CheY-like chemotaxis protein
LGPRSNVGGFEPARGFNRILGVPSMVAQLAGRLVLVVEDEPLVALDVADCLKAAGAQVIIARTLADALRESASADPSAAVLDHGLHDGNTSEVCETLKERGHTVRGLQRLQQVGGGLQGGRASAQAREPATVLVTTLAGVLAQRPIAN